MEHAFTGPSCTIGSEKGLMIVDGETRALVNAIEDLLEDTDGDEVKAELMESVLEIATKPAPDATAAAAARGVAIGSAGTHPFASSSAEIVAATADG